MECPFCGTKNRADSRFCSNCGLLLTPDAQDQSANMPTMAAGAMPTVVASTNAPTVVTSSSLQPGSRLQNNRYLVRKILGEGGMGAALLAEDTRLDDKQVVIKELISDNTDPTKLQEDVRNFKREVSTLVQIDHPLVPTVTDHFQEGSHYFMIQEYVAGENLENRLERLKRPLDEREMLTYASQLLDILDYLGERKPPIVHRDVKPANIIIGANDKRAHLVDFGIARADVGANAAKKQTSALGTPGYAPPEQYQGNADPRSDLYALAATMHHLLTDRDPREHAPFTYPPARTLNSKLSPDIERVLTRALTNDISQRYQSAAEMKREIDGILQRRFSVGSDTGAYTLNTSGPIGALPAANAASTAARPQTNQVPPTQRTVSSSTPYYAPPPPAPPAPAQRAYGSGGRGPNTPYPPTNIYGGQAQVARPARNNRVLFNFVGFIVVIAILAVIIFAAQGFLRGRNSPTTTGASAPTATQPAPTVPSNLPNGIGTYVVTSQATNSQERIGLSDGTSAFDTNRSSGELMQQAASRLLAKDSSGASSLWQQALATDPSNAEALIYQEDQNVLASGSPYITLVVGTMLTGPDSSVGRGDLQGAYVAQQEFNKKAGSGLRLRLLVASSGSEVTYTTSVATQIVQAAQADKTIVGVLGWPFSGQAYNAVPILARAQIPVVSQTASSDQLTGVSPYFFRVAPSNLEQGKAGAAYALQKLHATKAIVFYDQANAYSSSLADDFSKPFTVGGGTVARQPYTVGDVNALQGQMQSALSAHADANLIYFAGYASDLAPVMKGLPTTGTQATMPVLGGDALYVPNGYNGTVPNLSRLRLTTFSYPDTWGYLRQTPPAFFTAYPQIFNPSNKNSGYGYTRAANDTQLSYDALLTLLTASSRIGKTSFSGSDLQRSLATITGSTSLQGISGQISLGTDGNPLDKALIVLIVDAGGHFGIDSVQGRFTK